MGRYARLFAYFVRFSFSRAFEFRLDFTFRIVMDCIYYAVNLGFYKILFLHTPQVGGWTEPQVMIFVAGYLFVDALHMTLFSNNTWLFPQLVNKGDLDYYLVRPVSSLFFVSLRDFAANSFVNLLITIAILGWSFAQAPIPFSAGHILLYVALLLNGTVLFHAVHLLFLIPVFWTHSVDGLMGISWALGRVGERPDRIYRGWGRKIFTIFLPYCLINSFPARLVLDPFDWSLFFHTIGVSLAFWAFIVFLWDRALSAYSSASS